MIEEEQGKQCDCSRVSRIDKAGGGKEEDGQRRLWELHRPLS